MKKNLQIDNQKIEFNYFAKSNFWNAQTIIDNEKIEIEIDFDYHHEKRIDWDHFKSFFKFINEPNKLDGFVSESNNLVLEIGRAFFNNDIEIKDWVAIFSNAVFYNGKEENGFSFSLIYDFMHPTGRFGDDYGVYVAEYNNNTLKGIKRN